MIFHFSSEKSDLAKIRLPPRREHDFQGFAPLKNSEKSLKNREKINAKFAAGKTTPKNNLNTGSGGVWARFWCPPGLPKSTKIQKNRLQKSMRFLACEKNAKKLRFGRGRRHVGGCRGGWGGAIYYKSLHESANMRRIYAKSIYRVYPLIQHAR